MIHFKSKTNSVLFIAEIGGNHEGEFKRALNITEGAIGCRADILKYQLYKGESLVNIQQSPERSAHFRKFELSREEHIQIAKLCIKNGKIFMASVWDENMLDWIDPYLSIHKVGSGDLTNFHLISKLIDTGKPIIISTGLSNQQQIQKCYKFIEKYNSHYISKQKIAFLQCTSCYPTSDEDVNLNAMLTLKKEFKLPVGFSDHTVGSDALEVAVAMGATIIEKHFTDSRENTSFRDQKISLMANEVDNVIQRFELIMKLKGSGNLEEAKCEISTDHVNSFRRSIYASRDIKKGEIFSLENIKFQRPLVGISADNYETCIGQKSILDIPENGVISAECFQNE